MKRTSKLIGSNFTERNDFILLFLPVITLSPTAHINHPPSKPWSTAAAQQNLPEIEEFWQHRAAWSFSTARSLAPVDNVPTLRRQRSQALVDDNSVIIQCKIDLVLHNQILSCRKMWI